MTDFNNPNDPNNPMWKEIHHTIVIDPAQFQNDPQVLSFLPPEIRKLITRDIKQGAGGSETTKEPEETSPLVKIKYDYKMTNCNQNLVELTKKLKKSKMTNYGMLLYGVSGSGKSFYGQYLAQELKMPFIKKRASDLMDKFVGETEQNIAEAFKEAKEKKAILLLDEADSFLFDRKYADRDFQAMHVNELLTQMEDHPYPFIMTTNLKNRIDPASMRRFIFKIKFDYMKKDNIKAGLKTYFNKNIKFIDEQYEQLKYITAGDFKVAKRKLDILENGDYTSDLCFEYLLKEQQEKELDKGSKPISI